MSEIEAMMRHDELEVRARRAEVVAELERKKHAREKASLLKAATAVLRSAEEIDYSFHLAKQPTTKWRNLEDDLWTLRTVVKDTDKEKTTP